MTIDEAIEQERDIAEEQRKDNENCKYKSEYGCKGCAGYYSKPCIEYAKEHEQLAEWLEELKELREAKPKEIPIATIKFSKEDMHELVSKKIKEIELDIKAIRNKAIDDFAEKLTEQQIIGCMLPDGFRADVVTSHTVDIIAEQLKGGGVNE